MMEAWTRVAAREVVEAIRFWLHVEGRTSGISGWNVHGRERGVWETLVLVRTPGRTRERCLEVGTLVTMTLEMPENTQAEVLSGQPAVRLGP